MGKWVPTRSTIECKVCRSKLVYIALYHARIIYIHSRVVGMSRVCIHLGVHDHPITNDTCHELLDMSYQCVVNEVLKIPTTKSLVIIMAASKQILANYLLKSPDSGESHHLVDSSLEVVMDKFNTLASPNYRNFVSRSKHFSRNGM